MPSLADIPVPSVAPAAPAQEAPPEAAAPDSGTLPTPFDAIAAGQLPGLQVPPITKEAGALDPIQDFVVSNLHTLQASGLDFTDLPNDVTVVYNPSVVTTEAIAAAFSDGTLDQLIPSAQSLQEQAAPVPAGGLGGVPLPSSGPAPGPAGSTPPGVNRQRLANVAAPVGVKPNPIPNRLSKRAL
jgi:hypothetical protein